MKNLSVILLLLALPIFVLSQNEDSLIKNKYKDLLTEVKSNYADAEIIKLKEYKSEYKNINSAYELLKENFAEEDKTEIRKLKGEIQGYFFMRELIDTKKNIQEGYRNLKDNSEGFIASLQLNGNECSEEYDKSSTSQFLQEYNELSHEVENNYTTYTKTDWEEKEEKYSCLNYQYYKRKDNLSQDQRNEFIEYYKRYNYSKYQWKLNNVGETLKKTFNILEEKASSLFE